jgi:hypothetical protein
MPDLMVLLECLSPQMAPSLLWLIMAIASSDRSSSPPPPSPHWQGWPYPLGQLMELAPMPSLMVLMECLSPQMAPSLLWLMLTTTSSDRSSSPPPPSPHWQGWPYPLGQRMELAPMPSLMVLGECLSPQMAPMLLWLIITVTSSDASFCPPLLSQHWQGWP